MLKSLIVVVLIALVFSFCTEYEDGPYISLRSKEKKVCQKWKVESVKDLQYDETYTSMYRDWEMEITATGTYTKKIVYIDKTTSENGTWEFDGTKHIRFYYTENNSNFLKKYEIIRLSKNEMWLRDDLEEIHYRK